jgi:Mrp family chromosome partitioning ATPase
VLAGIVSLDSAITSVEVKGADGAAATTVDVLPAGLVPPSPVALLEGPATKPLLAQLRERYDIVLVDTPPATVVADAVAISDEVDGVVIVSRLGTVRRGALKRLREILTGVEAPVLGQIVNSDVAAKNYGYYSSAYTSAPKRSSRKAAKSTA